jgi:hypothetical protein
MLRLKQLARPGLIAAIFVLAFTLYSCGPVLSYMVKGISEQKMIGYDPFTRSMAYFVAQAVMLYILVYWITSRLRRDPNETIKSVWDEKTRTKK